MKYAAITQWNNNTVSLLQHLECSLQNNFNVSYQAILWFYLDFVVSAVLHQIINKMLNCQTAIFWLRLQLSPAMQSGKVISVYVGWVTPEHSFNQQQEHASTA